jgi:hypothetical protein
VSSSEGGTDTSGPSLRLVLGGIGVLAVVLGVLAYWRYTESEANFAKALAHMQAVGGDLDTEGCVDEVLKWHEECSANKPLCDNGVPRVLTHCLVQADRAATCDSLDMSSAKAQWVYKQCLDRGTPCRDKKRCACADAYRAIDSFCRHDQQGVAL